ncbi:uncharacterized protein CTRU02_202761 [Colletotrichum truncatum]|uniref:Uncharacterized protein n=1 Tax=Colletotrichum truncatum TaxID=5467 RepID=A0ACC3ZL93_COLTU
MAASLFFFGDQSQPASKLGGLVDKNHGILEWADMVTSTVEEDKTNPMTSALVPCIAQFGSLLWKSHHDMDLLGENCQIFVGQCSGLILACGAAAATSSEHLVKLSAEMLQIVVRMTKFVTQRSWEIEPSEDHSWATAVQLPREECLNGINHCLEHSSLPDYKKAYVSFQSEEWSVISGPPSTLRLLLSGVFANASKKELPIFAAYHASHLREPHVQILSSSTGEAYEGSMLRCVLMQALRDILQQPASPSRVLRKVQNQQNSATNPFRFHTFGPLCQYAPFYHQLKTAGIRICKVPALCLNESGPNGTNDDNENLEEVEEQDSDEDDHIIAITGYSGRFPGAQSATELWDLLCEGRDMSGQMPTERFAQGSLDALPTGCFLDDAGQFDTQFFNMSGRATLQTDPAHRLLLLVTHEALEMSGYNAALHTRHVGTYIGQATDDWREYNMDPDDPYYVTGGLRAFGPGRLNHFFGWDGPSLSVDTACSSSAMAIDLAVQALRGHKCEMAVAGGVNIITGDNDSGMYAGLGRGGFLGSAGTACKTFDATADGYTRGEAVSVVILKRLRDARKSGDTIHGVIRGIVTNHSTDTSPITRPSVAAQKDLLRRVLNESSREPEDVSYVEVHGSGTQAGDRAEVEAVAAVLGGERHGHCRTTIRPGNLRIGSVKANVGHSEGAAAITGLVKSLLILRHGRIPPHIGLKTGPNANFPQLKDLNIRINLENEPLRDQANNGQNHSEQYPSAIIINCFGAAGGNTSILIEQAHKEIESNQVYKQEEEVDNPGFQTYLITISAKTRSSLLGNKLRLLDFLKQTPNTQLSDLSYTTCVRRNHYKFRSAYLARTIEDLLQQLHNDTEPLDSVGVCPPLSSSPPQVVFVFPGQGIKLAGAAQTLFKSNDVFREALCDYSSLSEALGFPGVLDHLTMRNTDKVAKDTVLEQVSLVTLELALSSMWKKWAVRPSIVLGHSLGEYAAMHEAGILSASDTIWLVGKRASLVQQTCTADECRMLAVFAKGGDLEPIMKDFRRIEVACWNTPLQIVVAGPIDDILAFQNKIKARGMRSVLIPTPYAFHTAQMNGILDQLRNITKTVSFTSKPRVNFLSTVYGTVLKSCSSWSEYLVNHARQPVRFSEALQTVMSLNSNCNTLFITLSPTRSCHDMVAANATSTRDNVVDILETMRDNNPDCLSIMASSLAKGYTSGVDIDWVRYFKATKGTVRLLELPPYHFDLKDYWIPLVGKSKQVRTLSTLSPTCFSSSTRPLATGAKEATTTEVIRNLSQEPLRSLISGHAFREKAICPAGVLIDLAFVAALEMLGNQAKLRSLRLSSLRILSPIILEGQDSVDANKSLKVTVEKLKKSSELRVKFSSCGKPSKHHASCIVHVTEDLSPGSENSCCSAVNTLLRASSRIMKLRYSTCANHFTQPMIYKMWASVMHYSPKYQVLQDLVMASAGYEGAARILTTASENDSQTYVADPVWLDGIMQVAGFTVNMNVAATPGAVYILTECAKVTFWDCPKEQHVYSCYTHGKLLSGSADILMDVWVFDEHQDMSLVAIVNGLRFHKLDGKDVKPISSRNPSLLLPAETLLVSDSEPNVATSSNLTNNSVEPSKSGTSYGLRIPERKAILERLIILLAKETFSDPAEINEETIMADLGIDSLLTSSVAQSVHTELNVEVPLLAFLESRTVGDLATLCAMTLNGTSTNGSDGKDPDSSGNPAKRSYINGSDCAIDSSEWPNTQDSSRLVVLMQKSVHSKENMFLLPDASGSSAVYTGLPPNLSIDTNMSYFALESPFHGMETAPDCSMERYCSFFVEAIRRVQPLGPYMLGGWSLGGRVAYECARQLIQQGQHVAGLFLIESYASLTPHLPTGLDEISVKHLESTGFFEWSRRKPETKMGTAEWQRQHILRLILMNSAYVLPNLHAKGHEKLLSVPVQLVWSAQGDFSQFPAKILQAKSEIETRCTMRTSTKNEKHWLEKPRLEEVVAKHSDEWQRLIGTNVQRHIVKGDHFDIMLPRVRDDLAHVLLKAVSWFRGSDRVDHGALQHVA